MKQTRTTRGLAIGTIAALALGAGLHAQSRSGQEQRDQDGRSQSQSQRSQEGQESWSRQGSSGQQGGSGQDVTYKLQPQSWVAVGYDFDGDGSYDAVEYVFGYDLIRAREQSEMRARQQGTSREQQGRQAREAGFRTDTSDRSFDRSRSMQRTSGRIQSLSRKEFVGQDEPHVVAKIQTESGRTATVDLGPQSKLSRANLQQGDRIEVTGRTGKVDERTVLMADKVTKDGQQFRVDRTGGTNLRKFEGTIQQIRKVNYRNLDEEHMQARVQLRDGDTKVVDLGATSDLRNAQISQGKRIEFLADSVRINGEPGLRAEQIRIDGRKFELDREEERQRLQSQQQRQGQSQGSMR
jgi:hypothetical protein